MSPDLRPQTPMCWGGRSRRFCSSVMAQGSGLGWGLDVSSGSGDLVPSEELLRVSVKG